MKKFILFLCFLLIFGASTAWADCTVVSDEFQKTTGNDSMRTITLACEGDSEQTLNKDLSGILRSLTGWYLYRVVLDSLDDSVLTYTDVAANTDVYLWDSKGSSGDVDYMGSQGADALDPDSYVKINMNNVDGFYDDPILQIDNSNDGTCRIKLVMTAN